jgi:hypothetical protein
MLHERSAILNDGRKVGIGLALGTLIGAAGAWLSLSATSLAWPREYSYSGPRDSTVWAVQERLYQHIGLMVLAFGLAILLATFISWMITTKQAERPMPAGRRGSTG